MKKLLYLITIVSIFSVSGQEDTSINTDFIQGRWQVNIEETVAAIPLHLRQGYESLPIEEIEKMSNEMARQQMNFLEGGYYEAVIVDGPSFGGNWMVNGDMLQVSFSNGVVMDQRIISTTYDKLVLQVELDSNSTEFFHYVHLTLLER